MRLAARIRRSSQRCRPLSSCTETNAVCTLQCHGHELEDAPIHFRNDRDLVLVAVENTKFQYISAFRYASQELRRDRDFVRVVVGIDGCALQFASEDLRADREIVLVAVGTRAYALRYASGVLRADREVVLTAVRTNGCALQFASGDQCADREIVLAAVASRGW